MLIERFLEQLSPEELRILWCESERWHTRGVIEEGANIREVAKDILKEDNGSQIKIIVTEVFRFAAKKYFLG